MYSKEKRAIDFRALGIKASDSVLLLHAISSGPPFRFLYSEWPAKIAKHGASDRATTTSGQLSPSRSSDSTASRVLIDVANEATLVEAHDLTN